MPTTTFGQSCTVTHNLVSTTFLHPHMPITATTETAVNSAYNSHISGNSHWCSNSTNVTEYLEFVFRRRTIIKEVSIYRKEIYDDSTIVNSSYSYTVWANMDSAYFYDRSIETVEMVETTSVSMISLLL